MSFRTLVAGCGELGSRHLQALVSMPEIKSIVVVEPRPHAQETAQSRLSGIALGYPELKISWSSSLEQVSSPVDFCIVATQAAGRCQLVKDISAKTGCRRFLIEKIVSQSIAEYEDLLAFAQAQDLAIWVNCKSRAYFPHQRVKSKLVSGEPFHLAILAGNHGLANNGIHAADLFAFYDHADRIDLQFSSLDPALHKTRRGDELFDVSGLLLGCSPSGSHLTLHYDATHSAPAIFSISSASYRAVVDEVSQTFMESEQSQEWAWKPVPFSENWLVSHMTRQFAEKILQTGHCALPTLAEAAPAHRFILSALRPHFNKLLKTLEERCPVT